MRSTRLLSVLAALALLLMACQPADEPATTDTPGAATGHTPATGEDPGEDVDEAVLERLATAAANTVDEGTARFEIVAGTEASVGTGTDAGALTVRGQVDFDDELRELELPGPQGQLTAIVDGRELYVQLPAAEDEQYARIDLDELSGDGDGAGFGGPAGIPLQDPQSSLEALREAVVEARVGDGATASPTPDATTTSPTADATATGTPQVGATPDDAAQARLLFVVIDLELAGGTGTDANQFAAMADRYGIETIDMEVWIDEQDRIERIAYLVPLSEAGIHNEDVAEDDAADAEVEAREDLVVTITYSDFGVPVDIEVPEDDRVIDLDEEQLRLWLPDGPSTPTPSPTATTPTPTPTES